MYIYIKELKNDEELIKNIDMPNVLKKIIIKIKKIFNIVTVKKINRLNYLYIIPKVNNIKKIERIIKKNQKSKIILSKNLKKYEKELNLIKENKIIRYFIYDILQYITQISNTKIELQNLYILSNEYNRKNIEIIRYLIDKVKTVNIVTSNISKYSKLEEKIYSEEGLLITVTNNKKKGLKKSEIIINLDFDNETISKYKINRNAIIINCTNEKIETLKYFQGIIINNLEISIKEKEENLLYNEFDSIDIYENLLNDNVQYIENISKNKENKVKVLKVIGNNGTINEKEILNIRKNLDKK